VQFFVATGKIAEIGQESRQAGEFRFLACRFVPAKTIFCVVM
jgi:hypothetical protein